MTSQRVGIAVSGDGVRLWLPDGRIATLTMDEARDLAELFRQVFEGES